jgi:hypothetical protein
MKTAIDALLSDDERTEVTTLRPRRREPDHGVQFVPGVERHFITPLAQANHALHSKERSLLFAWGFAAVVGVLLLAVGGAFVWWLRNERVTVFVRDSFGNLVQADAESFFRAGDRRVPEEFTAFVRRWVTDCYTWTPVDVKDRVEACLRVVEKKAHPVAKMALHLDVRARQTEEGVSGGVYEEGDKEPQAVVMRTEPLEVMVSIERYLVDRTGVRADAGALFIKAVLREVPRSSRNGYGLMIADVRASEKL